MSKSKDSKSQAAAPSGGPAPTDMTAGAERPDLATASRESAGKRVWTGAAVGIGSAAIVAALLYARKKG
jgi:hypothetical protein